MKVLNKIITFVICFMLVNVNLTYDKQVLAINFGNQAQAQMSTLKLMGLSDIATASSGEDKSKYENLKIDEADGNFFNSGPFPTIIFMAAGFVIWKLIKACEPNSMDIMAAGIGAAIYIISEVMSAFTSNKKIEDVKTGRYRVMDEDGNIDNTQRQALEDEKAVLEEVKSNAEDKEKYVKAASTVFYVASLLAMFGLNKEYTAAASCTGAIEAAFAGTTTFVDTTYTMLETPPSNAMVIGKPVGSCNLKSGAIANSLGTCLEIVLGKEAEKPVSAPSLPKFSSLKKMDAALETCMGTATTEATALTNTLPECEAAVASFETLECGPLDISCTESGVSCKAAASCHEIATTARGSCTGVLTNSANTLVGLVSSAVTACEAKTAVDVVEEVACTEVISPYASVERDPKYFLTQFIKLLIPEAKAGDDGAWALLGFLTPFIPGMSAAINFMTTSNATRIILWGVLGVWAGEAADFAADQAKAAEDGIAEIDKILNKMDNSNDKIAKKDNNLRRPDLMFGMRENQYQEEIATELPCLNGEKKVNQTTGKTYCPGLEFNGINRFAGAGIPGGMGTLNMIGSMAPGVQGLAPLGGGFTTGISNLAGLNDQAVGALKKRMKKLNAIEKKLGKKPTDFKAMQKKLAKDLLKIAKKGKGGSLAGFGGSGFGLGGSSSKTEKSSAALPVAGVNFKGGSGLANPAAYKKPDFNFNIDEEVKDKESEFAANQAAVDKMAQEGGEVKNDIIKNKDVSIFKVISIRYMKSGFKKLLDEL